MWKNRITGEVFEDRDTALTNMVELYSKDIRKVVEGNYTVSDLLGILWSVAIGEDDPDVVHANLLEAYECAAMTIFDEHYVKVENEDSNE